MIHSELLADQAVLVLTPAGPLTAADFTRIAVVYSMEPVEYLRQVVLRNPHPLVHDADGYGPILMPAANSYLAPVGRVLDGVAD